MEWLNLRIALAHLLPGFLPPLLILVVISQNQDLPIPSALIVTLIIIVSVILGILIDSIHHRYERYFILWVNLTWISYWFHLIVSKIRGTTPTKGPLREAFLSYDMKERQIVHLWLQLQLEKKPDLLHNIEIENNVRLRNEFVNPTITGSEKWVLLSLLEHDSLGFMLNEYYSYYEFFFNFLISLVLVELLTVGFFVHSDISLPVLIYISIGFFIFFVISHQVTIFWLLSFKRFARKVLEFSILK